MTGDAQKQPSGYQIANFLQYLTEILANVTSPPPESLLQLRSQVNGMKARGEPHLIVSPPTFYRMSSILYQGTKPTMGELSRALLLPLSTTTRMVSWLVENGSAQRLSDPNDGRIVRVTLTYSGRRVHEAIENLLEQSALKILACLTAEENIILLTLLGKVASSLKKG